MNERPRPWMRRTGLERVELWFPFDPELVRLFKQAFPTNTRRWDDEQKCWIVTGPMWCGFAESWFDAYCGRGREIGNGQLEMAL